MPLRDGFVYHPLAKVIQHITTKKALRTGSFARNGTHGVNVT